MDSVIISWLCALYAKTARLYLNSRLCAILMSIYNSCRNAYRNSGITNTLLSLGQQSKLVEQSLVYRTFALPFTLTDSLRKKLRLKEKMESSPIAALSHLIYNNILALNISFCGVMLASFALFYMLLKPSFSPFLIVALLIGTAMAFVHVNLTSFIKKSWVFSLFEALLSFDICFRFVDFNQTKGSLRYICALVLGLSTALFGVFLSPLAGLAFVPGLLFLIATLKHTNVGVFTLCLLAPFIPTMAVAALCILCISSLLLKSVTDEHFQWKFGSIEFLLLALLIIYGISAATSMSIRKSVQIFALDLVLMGVYFVLVNTLKTKQQLFSLLKCFTISALLTCVYGFLQYFFKWELTNAWIDKDMFQFGTRMYSTLENPNVFGEYLLLTIAITTGLFLTVKDKLPKTVYFLISIVMTICLILTQSRGCYLGFILLAAIIVSFTNGKLWGVALLIIPFLPILLPQSIIERFLSIGDMSDSSSSYRVFIWNGTIALLRDYWAYGIGLGEAAFASVYPFYSYNAVAAPHAHNTYLQMITETGISGLVIFLSLLTSFSLKMLFVIKKHLADYSPMALCILAGVAAFCLQGMFDYTFYNYRVMCIFFVYLAIGMSVLNISLEKGHAEVSLC